MKKGKKSKKQSEAHGGPPARECAEALALAQLIRKPLLQSFSSKKNKSSSSSFFEDHKSASFNADEEVLLHSEGGAVPMLMVRNRVFNERLCKQIIDWAESFGIEVTKQRATRHSAFRMNGRISVTSQAVADALWEHEGLRQFVMEHLGDREVDGLKVMACNPRIRVYKYEAGHSFGKHLDESENVIVDLGASGEVRLASKYTVLIYLSHEDLEGGETVFYPEEVEANAAVSISPRTGTALLHAHGSRCLTHEALEVKKGFKYVLRTDLLFG